VRIRLHDEGGFAFTLRVAVVERFGFVAATSVRATPDARGAKVGQVRGAPDGGRKKS
jgi:hypothetical protein